MNRVALLLSVGGGILLLLALLGQLAIGDVQRGLPYAQSFVQVIVFLVPAILYSAAFGFAAFRIRPRASSPRLFHILFLPILAFSLCIFLWSTFGIAVVFFAAEVKGFWDSTEDLLSTIVLIGVLSAWAWSVPLLFFTRNTAMLLVVGVGGAAWLAFLLIQIFGSLHAH